MNKTFISVLVLVVLIGGAFLIFGQGKKAEAPMENTNTQTNTKTDTSTDFHLAQPRSGEVKVTDIPTSVAVDTVKSFTVTGQNFSFSPSVITVKKGDKVKITFKNVDGFHNFMIDEYHVATSTINAGAEESVEFTADKAGSFQYYCFVGTHRAMGMWGTLKVE